MIKLLEKDFPNLSSHINSSLNKDICNHLQMFVNDRDVLVASLIQNPFGITPNIQAIKKDFSPAIAEFLELLNALHQQESAIFEEYDNHKSIIILYLINHQFIFASQDKYPDCQSLLTPERIQYAMFLLEKLDVSEIRGELEDQFFNFLEPEVYNHYTQLLKFTRESYQSREKEIKNRITKLIEDAGIHADVQSRLKSIFSVHKKILKKKILYSQVLDTIGLRIIVDNEKECYQVMGIILKNCAIISNKIKDYIAVPKGNGYQSIHLTIMEGQQPVEIQIRTKDMHHYAQYGLAAHHQYKAATP